MKKFNIVTELPANLGKFEDYRGTITDLFFNETLNHVALIESVPNVMRGNHYHAKSTQHMFIVSGSLEYWFKSQDSGDASYQVCLPGDLITSSPGEIHALKIGPDGCVFMAFTEGVRGGSDYESDTFRVESIIPE